MEIPMSKALNWLKDHYLILIDLIEYNPQKAFWIAVALIVAGLFV